MINYYTIGQRVKEARKKKHLSQADLAEAVEKSTSYISYMETGLKCMSLETLVDIANALMDLLDDVAIAQKELVLDALSLFSRTKLDYVDCIYIAESKARNERVLTFDKKMISKMKQLGIPE